MSQFIASVVDQEKTDEGIVVTVMVTGFGGRDGPLMARAKARAIVAAGIGSKFVSDERVKDLESVPGQFTEEVGAIRDESLFKGPISDVREKVKAFRRDGLLTEVQSSKKLVTEKVVPRDKLEEVFPENMIDVINAFEYEVLVRTSISFS